MWRKMCTRHNGHWWDIPSPLPSSKNTKLTLLFHCSAIQLGFGCSHCQCDGNQTPGYWVKNEFSSDPHTNLGMMNLNLKDFQVATSWHTTTALSDAYIIFKPWRGTAGNSSRGFPSDMCPPKHKNIPYFQQKRQYTCTFTCTHTLLYFYVM